MFPSAVYKVDEDENMYEGTQKEHNEYVNDGYL
jgi:hypothetical protein